MFESAFIDAFSRTQWWLVPAVFIPVMVIEASYSVAIARVSIPATLALMAFGALFWTFIEYWLHRLLFHWTPPGRLGARVHFLLHGVHHAWPRDPYRLVMPPAVNLVLFWVFLGTYFVVFGNWAFAIQAGGAIGYVNYECTHYFIHHRGSFRALPWMKAMRRHHLTHHSERRGRGAKFGVSTTLWDHVFRTYVS